MSQLLHLPFLEGLYPIMETSHAELQCHRPETQFYDGLEKALEDIYVNGSELTYTLGCKIVVLKQQFWVLH